MKLEQQVTSLELSKKLQDLGVKQESLYDWVVDSSKLPQVLMHSTGIATWGEVICSAFTVAELGELLPNYIERNGEVFNLETNPACYLDGKTTYGEWSVGYWKHGQNGGAKGITEVLDENEANARAKMLIYLLENKLK